MSRLPRLASALLAALLVIGLAAPAEAAGTTATRRKQQETKARRAQAASKLNALKASDAQLERAVAALVTQTKAQTAKVASARQAVAAADRAVAAAEAKLQSTQHEMDTLKTAVVNRAVQAYVRPQQTTFAEFADAKSLGEASRRHSMLLQVANHDRDVIDRLRAVKEDITIEQEKAEAARATATKRRSAVESELSVLKKNLAEKARLETALDSRIKAVQAEIDGLAREESNIQALIARQAAARASRGEVDAGDGGRVSGAGLIWPTRGSVTSGFGYRWGRMHTGIDIAAPTGTPIRAAKGGQVISAGYMGGYGNCVVIDHGGGFTTLYAHMSRIGAGDGSSVSQGDVIGYVGSTGHSTGPHLHFETRVGGSPQNPMRYL